MAIITLNANETLGFTLAGDNLVFGTPEGNETVTIGGGNQVLDGSFNAGGDTIAFTGAASAYSIVRSGSSLIITGPNGTVVTLPAPDAALADADRPVLRFSDVTLPLDTDTSGAAPVFTVGTQVITTTATTIGGGDTTPPPALTVDVQAGDVTEGAGSIIYTFTLSAPQTQAVTINVATVTPAAGATGLATPGTDYTPASQTITFAPGQTVAFFTVAVLNDTIGSEGQEDVVISVTGATLGANADLTATITDDDGVAPPPPAPDPLSFELTTGADTFLGGALGDRISGAQNILQPGKLLSQADRVGGGEGADTLVLLNAPGGTPNVLDDVDFTNVTSVEILESNYGQIVLGAQADEAGIVQIDTTAVDTQTVNTGTLLDISSAAFNNELQVTMSNSFADIVRTNLANGRDFINTGTTLTDVTGFVNAPLDQVQLVNQTNPVRITFTSAAAGNGSAFDADGTTLALTAQSEDGVDVLTGAVTRFDDEGIQFLGGQFDVRDISGTARGTFDEVQIGTGVDDVLVASVATGSYLNAGQGDDDLFGGNGVDFLVGGEGDDELDGFASADTLLGGAGDDVLTGGAGIDRLEGGAGSDRYVFAAGELEQDEIVVDGGTDAADIDVLDVTSTGALADAQLTNKTGFEELRVTDTTGAVNTITLSTQFGNTGATTIRVIGQGNDTVDAGAVAKDLLVFTGSGSVLTGVGNDEVRIAQGLSPAAGGGLFAVQNNAVINLGAGNDTLRTYYNTGYTGTITGGDGTDTIVAGMGYSIHTSGSATGNRGNDAVPYFINLGAGVTGFEQLTILSGDAAIDNAVGTDVEGNTVAYNVTVQNANIAAASRFIVDASALTAGVATNAGVDGIIGTSDDGMTTSNTLNFSAVGVNGGRSVDVRGGAGNDVITGSDGADLLTGNAGADTLRGGLGNDTANGGEGGDTYLFTNAELAAGDVIADDGTAGLDVITVTSTAAIGDALFANKTGVEELRIADNSGGVNVVTLGTAFSGTGITTVRVLNAGNDTVDASAATSNLLVFTGSGSVLTGIGNDEVRIAQDLDPVAGGPLFTAQNNSAISLGAGNDILRTYFNTNYTAAISGGDGTDTIVAGMGYSIHTSGTATGNRGNVAVPYTIALGTGVTGFEQLTLVSGDAAIDNAMGADVAGNTIAFNVTAQNANIAAGTTFIVDGSGLTAGVVTGLGANGQIGGTGADLDTTSANTLNFSAVGVSSNRAVDVRGGAGNDVLTGSDGSDTLAGNLGNDQLNGGLGNDTITGGLGNDTLNGGGGADSLDGGDGNDLLVGGAGFDTLNGGIGNDIIQLSVTEFNSDNDTVNGGDGTDILRITGTAGAQEIADVGFNNRFDNIEEITLQGGPGGANTAFTYTAGFFTEDSGIRTINLGANTDGSTVSVANFSTAGATINGSAQNSTLTGSQFADIFTDGGGIDTINGGGGDDILNLTDTGAAFGGQVTFTGGSGNDTVNSLGLFLFNNDVLSGGAGGVDVLNVRDGATGSTSNGFTVGANLVGFETINLLAGRVAVDNTAPTADVNGSTSDYSVTVTDAGFGGEVYTLTIDGSSLRAGVVTSFGGDGALGGGDDATADENLTVNASGLTGGRAVNVSGGGSADTLTGGSAGDTLTGGEGDDTLTGNGGNDVIVAGLGADTVDAGAGVDRVDLNEGTAARDTLIVSDGTASRTAQDIVTGFTVYRGGDADGSGAVDVTDFLTGDTDVIDFGSAVVMTTSSSIADGVVQAGVLQDAIDSSSSLLAAIQLVEQEFQSDATDNSGVIAFTYQGNAYIGEITDQPGNAVAAFTDLVRLDGVGSLLQLVDIDGAGGGTALGLIGQP